MKVLFAGPSESGKSRALRQLCTRFFPRVISVETVPEAHLHHAGVIRVFSWPEMRDALGQAADPRWERWHIAYAPQSEEEIDRLATVLAPPIRSASSTSITAVVGGIALECHELTMLAPSGRTSPAVKRLFVLGRHHKLSILGAVQRPTLVDRCTTSEAQLLLTFRVHEARDLTWWRDRLTPQLADVIASLEQHESLYYRPGSPYVHRLGPDYRVRSTLSLSGEALTDLTAPRGRALSRGLSPTPPSRST